MEKDNQLTTLLIGVASLGAALVAFVSPAQREFALIVLIALLIVLFVSLKTRNLVEDMGTMEREAEVLRQRTEKIIADFSFFKKIYKIEQTIKIWRREWIKKEGSIRCGALSSSPFYWYSI